MKTGIHIGSVQSKKKASHIISILKAINKYETSNKVGVKALETYIEVARVENVTISGCSISGIDKGINSNN